MAHNIDSIKTGKVGKNWGFLGTHTTSYIKKRSECMSSPEQNYFSHFSMRYTPGWNVWGECLFYEVNDPLLQACYKP